MSLEEEKKEVAISEVERRPSTTESASESLPDGELLVEGVRAAAERRLVRMLDTRLLPTIILIFIMNYIDVRSPPIILLIIQSLRHHL